MPRKLLTIIWWILCSTLLFVTLLGYFARWFALAEFAVSLRPALLLISLIAVLPPLFLQQ